MPRTPAAARRRPARAGGPSPAAATRTPVTRAPAADAAESTDMPRDLPGTSDPSRRYQVLYLTLALAGALVLVGLAGFGALSALHAALRPSTVTDEASAVCAYLRSQDYDALAREMDPAPAGASTGAFHRADFAAQLRGVDQREGSVRACSLRLLGTGPDGTSVVFALTVRRARVADPLGSLVVVEPRTGGGWALSRASTFYDSPE